MTSAAPEPAAQSLERDARALASTQGDLAPRATRAGRRRREPTHLASALERARKHFAAFHADDARMTRVVEWYLDNYYLIRRVARQVEDELPRGFMRHLPRLASGPSVGLVRIDVFARTLVATTGLALDAPTLRSFVDAYQTATPLTIAELWALPTMLRASVLRRLRDFLAVLEAPSVAPLHAPMRDSEVPENTTTDLLTLDPARGVEWAVRALRLLDTLDWLVFFTKSSRVEAILRTDPARVYARMDFETRDAYRKVVEALSWATGIAEPDVADRAIALAAACADDPRRGHVGHYLAGDGRATLEAQLAFRPSGLERVRRALGRHPTLAYLSPLALLTLLPLVAAGLALARHGASVAGLALGLTVAAIPASTVAVTFVRWAMARLLPPRRLPKLDFAKGLPDDARTLVVIPTLLGRADDVTAMLQQLELHYLSNPDPQLQFALLTDELDAKAMPTSEVLSERVAQGITALNARHGRDGVGPFHLLHRTPRWNDGEKRFMGWERKRGKLEELNRLLRGDTATSYSRHVGAPEGLTRIRFVLTLDSDTELPIGSARRLIGLLAHPLNQAVFDEATGRVVAGYTLVQPRIETSPTHARTTLFARIFAGDVGFDIYTHAVSELYQDLFGAGIYVGKGLYDVDAFARSVDGVAPENALVSHDLFEGIHGRAALASDVVLFEDYPSNYAVYARRMHRWVRGDWQLLPWLLPRVPTAQGPRVANTLAAIDRWKIADNLRRSLTSPMSFLLLVLGWSVLPGGPLFWTLAVLGLFAAPLLPSLWNRNTGRLAEAGRAALAVVFLAFETAVVADAVARVLVRTVITRRNLLQWTSAAHTASDVAARSPRALFWRTMAASPLFALALTALLAWRRPAALIVAAPLLALWCLAPEIARWVSRPARARVESLAPEARTQLRRLARQTWRFFDAFVGPNDQWLPVDNYQEEPREQTAHRTSPTNIGLMMVSTLTAYDFGYLGPSEFSLRIRRTFDSVSRLEHYRGHLLNWYETRNLQPLLPRYVSTVDSGNFAGCLLALKHGCLELATAPIVRDAAWNGLDDALDLLEAVADPRTDPYDANPVAPLASLRAVIARVRHEIARGRGSPHDAGAVLQTLCNHTSADLDRALLDFLATGAPRHEPEVLRGIRMSADGLRHQLRQLCHELDALLPWLALRDEPAATALEWPVEVTLDAIPAAAQRLHLALDAWVEGQRASAALTPALEASAATLTDAFASAAAHATALHAELLALAGRADDEVRAMDFRLLYDGERRLFHIGYNATIDALDPHYYDLLASEARLASYLAIVKGDVPIAHWFALGRPMTTVAGGPALLSWGGTMFEYLMPGLMMRSQTGTLLARTAERAVDAQIAYGTRRDEPWGVSESAYARLDAQQTYQYQSFGVPGLGFRRGLELDRVVTPYASLMALSIRPRAVVANLARLDSLGMRGTYGLFEAIDYTPARAEPGRAYAVVRSYMAHHQGMLLVALGNELNDRGMVARFHAEPRVATGEALLDEHAPATAPREWPIAASPERVADEAHDAAHTAQAAPRAPTPWAADAQARAQATVLSNGRLHSLATDSGGGGLTWHGLALTRFQPDPSGDEDGLWIYLRDKDQGRTWLATSTEGRTTYGVHSAAYHRREEGLSVHVEITVAPADDVELRQITLHNESDRPRRFTVASVARPVLLDAKQAPVHPAFSSLFVESESLAELDGLLFARRPQSPDEPSAVLVHRLVREGAATRFAGFETDRAVFYGRAGDRRAPASLAAARPGVFCGAVGDVLDPVMSVMAHVDLEPNRSVTLAFVTAVARSRRAAIELAHRYGTLHAVRWAFRDAEQESPRRLQRARLDPALAPTVQRLFSALLFADPTLRAWPEDLAAASPSKRRLWGRGISGDDPIVLVRVHDPAAPVVGEVLAAQRYLRTCGVRLDLVLIDEQPSGYDGQGSGTLRGVLAEHDVGEWLDRHGGVYVVAADRVARDERLHLEACARVVLDTRSGTLAAHLARAGDLAPRLPRFEAVRAAEPAPRSPSRPTLLFDNGQGGFSADGREYVVTVAPGAPTPAPWCNVMANPDFGCLATESSLGASWSINSGENRLTPWRNDAVFDAPSEVLYLRDEESAAVWSPTPLPAGGDAVTQVHHGAGYTRYARESHGLRQELTVFVPPDASLKIVRLRLQNTLARRRRLTATYYAEWVLGARRDEQRPYVVATLDRDHACLLAACDWNAEFAGRVAFVGARDAVHGATTDRTEFLGRSGDYAHPAALARWGLSGSVERGVDPCAALQVHLELDAGATLETHFVLGQAASHAEALALVARFREPAAVDAAWTALTAFQDEVLGCVRVKTPEPAMDLMLNRWLLNQTLSSRFFGRTGFYQSSGAFGFRDQLQDVLALMLPAPARVRAHILESAAHQFEAGDVLHWWHPPSGRGVRTRCSDDLLWLPYATAEYVAATGDVSILEVPVAFLAGDPLRPEEQDRYAEYAPSTRVATLMEHCRLALEHGTTAGAHGLPLMGGGDWNDGMNRVGAEGRGESVWLGWFLCATMDRFAALCARTHDDAANTAWIARAQALRARLEATAWDGAWYLRAFHDDGSLLGSSSSRACRIDSIPQSWSVLARDPGTAATARARAAVSAADEQLVREADRLVLLFWPPFDTALHDPGYVRAYPPGIRENGGQYTHAATWLGWAHASLGDGAGAERIFRLLNPILHASSTRYRVEPYALAGDIYSCAPWVGRGGWSWYTGSAAWMWRLGIDAILGIRIEDGALVIDPCIPPTWPGFEAWISLDGQSFHVVVENPDHVSTGVVAVTVDGASIDGHRVPRRDAARGTREVRVRLGVPSSARVGGSAEAPRALSASRVVGESTPHA